MAGTVIFRPKAKPASIWGAMMSKSPFAQQGELMAAEDPATPLGWVAAKPRRLTPELMTPKPLSGRDLLVDPLPLSDETGREATVVEPMPDTLVGSAGDDTLDESPAPRGGFLRRLADHPTMLAGISAGANTPGSFLTGLNAMASQGLAGAGQDEKISVLREQRAQAAKERAARDVFNRMVESGDIQSPRAIAAFNKAYPDQAGALFRDLLSSGGKSTPYTDFGKIAADEANGILSPEQADMLRQNLTNGERPDFQALGQIRKEVQSLPSYKNLAQAMPIYRSMVETAPNKTRASDLALVYGLGKIMDPNSVVREGEAIMVRDTASLPDWLIGEINRLNGGNALQNETRDAILREAGIRLSAYQDAWDIDAQQYKGLASRYGLNPDDVLPSFGGVPEYNPLVGEGGGEPAPESIPTIATPEEARRLPPGTQFRTPDGRIMVR